MKFLFTYLIGITLSIPALATGLMWDDVQTVPAIKIGIDQFQSCKKGLSLETTDKDRGTGEQFKDGKKHYQCIDFKNNRVSTNATVFTTQQLANEYVGDNIIAVGTQPHKLDSQPGQFTVTNVYIDLYYKMK